MDIQSQIVWSFLGWLARKKNISTKIQVFYGSNNVNFTNISVVHYR